MHKKEEVKLMPRTVKIEGMMCQHCVKHVNDALTKLGLKAEVSLENAAMFFISPRKIALVQSTEMFASAIYLEIPEGDEEDDE